jgi:hypothetical protein
VSTHTLYCLKSPFDLTSQYFLCGLFNSFVVNFLVRLRVTSHVSTRLTERLPIPRREQAGRWFRTIAALARRLERRDDPRLAACLNAGVAQLYTLDKPALAHVLDSFPLVPLEERAAVLHEFNRISA